MKPLKIHFFLHVVFEDPGCILNWCDKNGHQISYTKFYQGDAVPELAEIDWLIVMGGPMGIYDDSKYPWLSKEKEAIKQAIDLRKKVVGICLGAQLIAGALGERVFRNPEKEIGWFDIFLTQQGKNEPLFSEMKAVAKVFHWHGDTFNLPRNAIHVAASSACISQCFLYNNIVLGIQFHLEVTTQSLQAMIENGRHELTGGPYIQHEKEIVACTEYIEENNRIMFRLLDHLFLQNV